MKDGCNTIKEATAVIDIHLSAGSIKVMQQKQEVKRWLYKIAHALNSLGVVIIFLLMLLTVTDVVLRKVFSKGILGTLEISEFMMAAMVFFSLAEGELNDRNVNVDLVVNRLSAKIRAIIDAIVKIIGFVLYCFIAFAVFRYATLVKSSGEVSLDLWLPKYPLIYIVAVALILFSVVLFFRMLVALQEMWRLWTR
jgi:TRAP-type C4-dicarboxylate transport system permease small subunit